MGTHVAPDVHETTGALAAWRYAVTTVGRVLAATSSTCPGILIRPAAEGQLTLTAWDSETTVSVEIPGTGAGTLLVDHEQLLAKLNKRRRADTTAVAIRMTDIGAMLSIGARRTVPLTTYDPADFPGELPDIAWVASTDRQAFEQARAHVAPAMSRDPSPDVDFFHGAKLHLTAECLTLSATNREHLAVAPTPTAAAHALLRADISCVVPPAALDVPFDHGTGAEVHIGYTTVDGRALLSLSCENLTIVTTTGSAHRFPDHDQLMPKATPSLIVADRLTLLAMLARSTAIASAVVDCPRAVAVTIAPDSVSVAPVTALGPASGPPLRATTEGVSEPRRMIFRTLPLSEILERLSSPKVVLHLIDAQDPHAAVAITAAPDGLDDRTAVQHLLAPIIVHKMPVDDNVASSTATMDVTFPGTALTDAIATTDLLVDPEAAAKFGALIQLHTTADGVEVIGNRPDTVVSVRLPLQAHGDLDRSPWVDATQLRAVLAAIVEGNLEPPPNATTISADDRGLAWVTYAGYRVPLPTSRLSKDDVPKVPVHALEVDGADFAQRIPQLLDMLDLDHTLPLVRSIMFHAGPDTLAMSATDRYQVGSVRLAARPVGDGPPAGRVFVTATVLAALTKHIDNSPLRVDWSEDGSAVTFVAGPVTTMVRRKLVTAGINISLPFMRDRTAGATLAREVLVAAVDAVTEGDHDCVAITPTHDGLLVAPHSDGRGTSIQPRLVRAQIDGHVPGTFALLRRPHLANATAMLAAHRRITLHFTVGPVIFTPAGARHTDDHADRYAAMPWIEPTDTAPDPSRC